MIELLNEDCLEVLRRTPSDSVDLFLQDPPYATTQNKWDKPIKLQELWPEWIRVGKINTHFIFTAAQPFATDLINSNRKLFRYDLVWFKRGKATGFLNANRMPLRAHEYILVFYNELPTYNPQKTKGSANYSKGSHSRGKKQTNNNYGTFDQSFQSAPTDDKFPLSVIEFPSVHPPIHPTQKPVDLMRWFIRTYSNEGDTVFDGYSGSGTTAAASHLENRNAICCENDTENGYFANSVLRLNQLQSQTILF